MSRTLGSESRANLRHRNCTFFICARITHVSRRPTLSTVAMALLVWAMALLMSEAGNANATPADGGLTRVSIAKYIDGDKIHLEFKHAKTTGQRDRNRLEKHIPTKVLRQDGFYEYFPSASQALEQDELLANRVGIVVGALGNTFTQLFFGTNDLRSEVTFWCANPYHTEYQKVVLNDADVHQKLEVSKPIMFLTHGWTDGVNRTWVKDIVGDYVKYIGGNICAVDWSRLALVEYNLAARNTPKVGRYLAKFVKFLLRQGFTIDQVTLVGHSMGAHISGIAGAALNGTVPMIVGLDPAGPSFTKPFLVAAEKRLDKGDAMFVQAIHTDKNIIGTSTNVGHQDFYTNTGGSPQPGCEFPLVNNDTTKSYLQFICSHFKAVEYFRASLNPQNIFEGTNCGSYYYYRRGECSNNTRSDFGLYNTKTALGALFVSIDKTVYPYAKSISRNT
ncbi:phospholipase A1 3-like [Toxorhynchites rutilus septentrionalis]|uniref:phospholipase A1 3-like n=1 Tax=Toxorhynchites rutilus septentrionalis TaxID=329112 RepID=UPI00247A18DF|nr:phospholipase A1 3-like [Toxorhynchites rutilus septentrionalis]XP_055617799.1 phospholipase A1 3-like [Toxorhynchites rutilus septentrionalis]XP_055617800.1 phospholipase A1 3-like [Toxorhynchites rutilus septentrionalis]XP_055617801.1 phospholipase A1 3-like [Toxorhynchites rutilus septentrionalis]XP_055617803.1 phospholipase A1 3-like [Toxorhynchites rutilus septentrionalis]XP_055617804.1 phospholipase A1 3-like [Toxorhynchites rutilus septentrionalis]XP_055617805.1 phospholipase A1 3-l